MLRESIQILKACKKIEDYGLVLGTWGNVSMILKDGSIIITPSGIPYDELREEDLVICDQNESVISGKQKPSSELKMHITIYKNRHDIRAVIHTHSLYASVASSTLKEVPIITEDAAMVLGNKIKVTNYKSPGTQDLANEVSKCLKDANATIMANHGQVGIGQTMEEALFASVMCEKTSKIYIKALGVSSNPNILRDKEIHNLREIYVEHYMKLKNHKR